MRLSLIIAAIVAGCSLVLPAQAQTFSTSALSPTPLPADGVIAGTYPAGEAETTYYFAADLKAGDLLADMKYQGRSGPTKSLSFGLVDPSGRRFGNDVLINSDANQDLPRVIPIDASGRYVLRVTAKGPETTAFRIELGGSALSLAAAEPRADRPFSQSFLAPAPLPADNVIAGKFPGSADGYWTIYYFSMPLKAGQLLTQLSVMGRRTTKETGFRVYDTKGHSVGNNFAIGDAPNLEATKGIAIDNSGRYVLRVAVRGAEGTNFRLEVGGDAVAAH